MEIARDLFIYSDSQSAIQSDMWQNRAADPTCAASLDMGALHKTWICPIYRYYFGKCSSELATLVLIPYGYQCSSHSPILIGCMIFPSPFLML